MLYGNVLHVNVTLYGNVLYVNVMIYGNVLHVKWRSLRKCSTCKMSCFTEMFYNVHVDGYKMSFSSDKPNLLQAWLESSSQGIHLYFILFFPDVIKTALKLLDKIPRVTIKNGFSNDVKTYFFVFVILFGNVLHVK